jgi:hypothetical protein
LIIPGWGLGKEVIMRRRFLSFRIPMQFKFIRLVMIIVIISFFVNAYISIRILGWRDIYIGGDIAYFIFQLNFGAILLILLITMAFILHRGFGALTRIEEILDKAINGQYSSRIQLRKGDTLVPLVGKINKILDLLEGKHK